MATRIRSKSWADDQTLEEALRDLVYAAMTDLDSDRLKMRQSGS